MAKQNGSSCWREEYTIGNEVDVPTVSVIIPTHNRLQMLKRAIRSVLTQTYEHFELIVVDDNSTDDTEAVVASFEDNRLRYFKHDVNKGASAARNTGIKHANGEYIAFLDDDDEWLPTKLEKQVHVIQNAPEKIGLVYCWMDYFKNGKLVRKHHPTLKGSVFDKVLDEQRLGGCPTLLVRGTVINKVGMFDESLRRGNDGDFIRRVCRKYHVDFVPEVLVKVHVAHDGRISSESEEGHRRAIQAQEIKFYKFKDDIEKMPKVHANILRIIAHHHFALGNARESQKLLYKAIKLDKMNVKLYLYMLKLKLRGVG